MSKKIQSAMDSIDDRQLSQLVVQWVSFDEVRPNSYNPNAMAWHDRMLLRASILEDGWTQPIVVNPKNEDGDYIIIDGEQRWATAGLDLGVADIQDVLDRLTKRQASGGVVSQSIIDRLQESASRLGAAIEKGLPARLASVTMGFVPITIIDLGDEAHKKISTIRHNRARGSHSLDIMSEIVKDLDTLGLDVDDLESRLGMTNDEISRLMDRAEVNLAAVIEDMDYNASKEIVYFPDAIDNPELKALISDGAAQRMKEHQTAQQEEVSSDNGDSDSSETAIISTPSATMRKFQVFFTPEEQTRVLLALRRITGVADTISILEVRRVDALVAMADYVLETINAVEE